MHADLAKSIVVQTNICGKKYSLIKPTGLHQWPRTAIIGAMSKTLLMASDHGGLALKETLKAEAVAAGWQVVDLGTDSPESVDYPVYAQKLCMTLLAGEGAFGVLICGTGIGMSLAANRFKGIRAALCHDVTTARLARQHNNANVLCLGGRILGPEVAKDCLTVFLVTEFAGGRHQRRLELLG